MQRFHTQDHTRKRAAQNLRIGKPCTTQKVLLVVQTNANAIGHTSAPTRALVGSRLADGLDHQLLDLAAPAVTLDPRASHVDHIANAGHGERGLGHIGG